MKDMQCILAEITRNSVGGGALDAPLLELTHVGTIVENEIVKMNTLYSDIKVSKYVIMPNHLHLMIEITRPNGSSRAPTPTPANALLPQYISTLKRMTNKQCGTALWQRSFYDHIIRDEADYIYHLQYIEENPKKWVMGRDEYYT
ncbi:MAG: transposase [Clostridia bacterium]|nr:transposase [Clostridia bacterium]